MSEISKRTIVYLNILLATNYFLACMDELEGVPVFKHKLKQTAKKFRDTLVQQTEDDMNKVWDIKDQNTTMYNLMEHQENVLKAIAVMRPEECGIILEMINRYKLAPEGIKSWLGIKIIEQEEVV